MPSALERIVESFLHPIVLPILGQPAYKTIADLQLKLNTNAASIYSHRGNGELSLVFLTVKPSIHNSQSTTEFNPPNNPRPYPTIPKRATGPQIEELRHQHKVLYTVFQAYQQADKALKTLLIFAIDEAYIHTL